MYKIEELSSKQVLEVLLDMEIAELQEKILNQREDYKKARVGELQVGEETLEKILESKLSTEEKSKIELYNRLYTLYEDEVKVSIELLNYLREKDKERGNKWETR